MPPETAPTAPVTETPAAAAPAKVPNPDAAKNAQTPPVPMKTEKVVRVRSHERAARLKEKLEAELEREESTETSDDEGGAPVAPQKPGAAAPEKDEAALRAAARIERMRVARERERAEETKREAHRVSTQATKTQSSELEKLRQRVAELEPHEKIFASEDALLAAAEKNGLPADKLIAWMRKRLNDPEAIAAHHVQTEAEKLRAEMKAIKDEIAAAKAEQNAERQAAAEQHQAIAKSHQFVSKAKTEAADYPLTAKIHKVYGDNGLVTFANQFIAPLLPEEYSIPVLHDHVEQFLHEILEALGAPAATPGATPGKSPPAKNAAAQATTLSNSLAQERPSVTEEVPRHLIPLNERAKRLKERLERAG